MGGLRRLSGSVVASESGFAGWLVADLAVGVTGQAATDFSVRLAQAGAASDVGMVAAELAVASTGLAAGEVTGSPTMLPEAVCS